MDLALNYFDDHLGDRLYAAVQLLPPALHAASSHLFNASRAAFPPNPESSLFARAITALDAAVTDLPRDSVLRQCLSLYAITYIGILLLYFGVATGSYYFLFDRRMEQHPRYLKNQVAKEIAFSLEAFPVLDLLTLPWFLGDVRGWSMLYDSVEEGPFGHAAPWQAWAYMAASAVFFLLFTDLLIYWVHRVLHHPVLYKRLHKPHHKWIIPTPFASHAFHPVDGYLQSVPYHLCVYLIPIHKYLFIGLFTFVNLWSIFIHDSDMISDHPLSNYINGPSHHTLHHIHFTVNYGQYFCWADKMGGSFRAPAKGEDPLLAVLAAMERRSASAESSVCSSDAETSSIVSVETSSSHESSPQSSHRSSPEPMERSFKLE